MIKTQNVSFTYSADQMIQFPDIKAGDNNHFLLLGESGSGKTTLLHLLGGLLRNYKGSIQMDNKELSSLSETELDKFRGQHIGFIFQRNHLISALTVEKNLMMAPYLASLPIHTQ